MNFRKLSLLGLVHFICINTNAQFYDFPNQSIVQANKNPASPTMSSLGNFSEFNVDYFSGRVTTSIPISNLEIDGFKLPVQLNYLPTGIRVMSSAGWVGTGWSLSAGGVITRNVNGIADDKNGPLEIGYSYSKYQGRNWHSGLPDPNVMQYKKPYDVISEVEEADNVANSFRLWDLKDVNVPAGSTTKYDTEPDDFSYNFLGRSGKFFITPDRKALLVPYNDLKFELNFDDTENSPDKWKSRLQSIIITDEKGVKYYFDKRELSETSSASVEYNLNTLYRDPGYSGGSYYTSWQLSKIVLPNLEEISFNYQNETQRFPYVYRSQSIRNSPDADGNASGNASVHQDNRPQYSLASSTIRYTTQRLASIESRLWKINFTANLVREDVEGSNALTEIEVLSKENNTLKQLNKWVFNYRYHNCRTDYQVVDYVAPNPGPSTIANKFKRLFLDGITEVSNAKSNQTYAFTYVEYEPMPSPSSAEQDFWGYYNGNHAKTLMPKIGIYHDQTLGYKKYSVYHKPYANSTTPLFELPGANRVPHSYYAQIGSLKSIQYPTKGTLTFEYEVNDYEFEGEKYLGPGIRVIRTTLFDGIDHSRDIIKDYRYYNPNNSQMSSGVLFNFPAFAYFENTHDYYAPHVLIGNGPSYYQTSHLVGWPFDYPIQDIRRYQYYLSRLDHPQFVNSGINGDAIGYQYVTEYVNLKYKTVYHFSCPSPFGATTDPANAEDKEYGGAGDDLFKAPVNFACRSIGSYGWGITESGYVHGSSLDRPVDITGMDINQPFAYPFAPTYNYDWNRGLLLEKKEYDVNNVLVKQTTRRYKLFTPGNSGPKYFNALKLGYSENFGPSPRYPATNLPNNLLRMMDIGSKYKIMGDLAKLPEYEEVKLFTNNGNDPITTKYNFTYQLNSPQLKEISFIDSKNLPNKIVNAYPSDFALNGNIYQEMVNRNMVSTVLEKTSFVNNTETSKEKVDYTIIGSQVLPSTSKNSVGGASLETVQTNNLYDDKGNVLEYSTKQGVTTTLLYGYNKSCLVAKVVNSTYSQVSAMVDQSILNAPASDNDLRTELNKLRTLSGPNTFITTYTYRPLVGMTSQTDPNGVTNYYEYDYANRLSIIRDKDNNIIKKICYNYFGQQDDCSGCADIYPNWQNTTTPLRCQKNCTYTGFLEQEQKDINPCSSTYNRIRWIATVYNPQVCKPTSGVYLFNYSPNMPGFTAVFTNSLTGETYSFALPAAYSRFGCVPEGTYDITISKPGNTTVLVFSTDCQSVTGTSGAFKNVIISTQYGCTTFYIIPKP
jgi:hypothetical protein